MQLETVIYEKKDDIAMIRFNRPKVLNAINRQLTIDFLQALKEAQSDPEVKVVIVKGEGRAFSSGDDLSESKIVTPSWRKRLRVSYISRRISGARPRDGSSIMSSLGRDMRPLPRTSICRSPPLRSRD